MGTGTALDGKLCLSRSLRFRESCCKHNVGKDGQLAGIHWHGDGAVIVGPEGNMIDT